MKLKMVGLGKMGLNLALNMKEHGVDVEGFDVNEEARKKAESENIKTYASLEDVASKDEKNVIWVMLPAGKITNSVLLQLVELCKANDIVIDGGNSDHRDSLKTARLMKKREFISLISVQAVAFMEQDMEQALCVEEIQTYLKMSFKKCWKVLLLQTDVCTQEKLEAATI